MPAWHNLFADPASLHGSVFFVLHNWRYVLYNGIGSVLCHHERSDQSCSLFWATGETGTCEISAKMLDELIEKTEKLRSDEQLRLAARLVDRARTTYTPAASHRKWRDVRGLA